MECQATLPSECQNLRQTPVLDWAPQPNAGYYMLYLSYDRELTNLVADFPIDVTSSRWTWDEAFPDSQAGTAYYWYVRPCTAEGVCKALEYANHAFNKKSNPVELKLPANEAVVMDDVTFTWDDYLLTNTNAVQGDSALPTKAGTEAREYRIQVSVDPNFQSTIDNAVVDQRSFTSYANTYPEGNLYWRVQAIDQSANPLAWSVARTFQKQSPKPTLTSPLTSAPETVPGSTPLVWEALAYAGSYQVEVYKNGDTQANPVNRVVNETSTQIAWSPAIAAGGLNGSLCLASETVGAKTARVCGARGARTRFPRRRLR